MAAVPVGYEAFHSIKRKGVTLLCFLLASAMAMGITVYVDSYSVHEWDNDISSVGDVAIFASGYRIVDYLDPIRNTDGISKAAALPISDGNFEYWVNSAWGDWIDTIYGSVIAMDQEFMDIFPGYITLIKGTFPDGNISQVAIPDSLVRQFNFNLGDILNFSINWGGPYQQVQVIGIYSQGGEGSVSEYYWALDSIAIVDRDVIVSGDSRVYIDIDRNRISPFDAQAAYAFVTGIDQKIRALDPDYDPRYPWDSRFYVNDMMAGAINQYMYWVQGARLSQIFRSSAIIVLIVLVTFLAIRHNVNERRYEISMLYSRGASTGDLDKIINREIVILSILSCIVGIVVGVVVSRIAIASTGFFKFDFGLMMSEPFLISLQSLIMSVAVGIALPLVTLLGYRLIYSTKRSIDENTGRLAKLVRGFNFIRWDLLVVLFAGLLLLTLTTGGVTVTSNPALNLILPVVPIPLFLGMASLSIKMLRRGAVAVSRYLSPIVGKISASIGIRRIGKGASSGGAAAMVLVLAICLSWNSAIVDASLPVTIDNQAKLSVGADITFALDKSEFALWDEFMANVTNNEKVLAETVVSEIDLSLTSDYSGVNTFFAVDPIEYASIGYDYSGKHLNDSEMANMLVSLESIPDGAIISSDIASDYDLEVGDVLRAAALDTEALPISFRIIGIVTSISELPQRGDVYDYYILPPMMPYPIYSYYHIVGQARVMVNRDFLSTQIDILNDASSFLCVQTVEGANGTKIANDLLEQGGSGVVYSEVWDSVSTRTDEYMGAVSYHMDRSVDTMMTVLTVGTIMGAFAVYALEGIRARSREIALLRSNGADIGLIIKAQGAEMLVLMLFSFALLSVFAPLFLTTSVRAASTGLGSSYLIYPISVFLVIPWVTVLSVVMFLVVSVVLFIGVAAAVGSRINLAETLNATWAEAAPYGGDV